jgi:hypothetical protein
MYPSDRGTLLRVPEDDVVLARDDVQRNAVADVVHAVPLVEERSGGFGGGGDEEQREERCGQQQGCPAGRTRDIGTSVPRRSNARGVRNASAVERPALCRSVAIRRPGCTASRIVPSSSPSRAPACRDPRPRRRGPTGAQGRRPTATPARRAPAARCAARRRPGAPRRPRGRGAARGRRRGAHPRAVHVGLAATTWSTATAPLGCGRRRARAMSDRVRLAAGRRAARTGPTPSMRQPTSRDRAPVPASSSATPPTAQDAVGADREPEALPGRRIVGQAQCPQDGRRRGAHAAAGRPASSAAAPAPATSAA